MVIATLAIADVGQQLDRIEQVVVGHAVGVVAEEHHPILTQNRDGRQAMEPQLPTQLVNEACRRQRCR